MHACINEGWGGEVGWEWESFFSIFSLPPETHFQKYETPV